MSAPLAALLVAALSALSGLSARNPSMALWEFGRGLQNRQLGPGDEARILSYLALVGKSPKLAGPAARATFMVSALSVGKVAPEIRGTDLDGVPFALSDYRGKVVVLMFSGDWCGICRAQYPYERLMQELYRNWPFAIVSVDSGADPSASKAAMARERLTYRAFWDGGGPTPTTGPIATAWNAIGWPSVYVLDENGVIRYVDVLQEDLLKAVRTLVSEAASRK